MAALVALRHRGAAMPAGAVLFSPWVDLSDTTGPTWQSNNRLIDYLPRDLAQLFASAYAGDLELTDPRISPLFADLSGLPPLLVEAGGGEVLLGQIQAFTAAATDRGVAVSLTVSADMVHVFQLFKGFGMSAPGKSMARAADFISCIANECAPNSATPQEQVGELADHDYPQLQAQLSEEGRRLLSESLSVSAVSGPSAAAASIE